VFKQILPVDPRPRERLEQRMHEGYEWLYVISGRLRLALGEDELILELAKRPNSTPELRTDTETAEVNQSNYSSSMGRRANKCTCGRAPSSSNAHKYIIRSSRVKLNSGAPPSATHFRVVVFLVHQVDMNPS
jgi:hypothetical protein